MITKSISILISLLSFAALGTALYAFSEGKINEALMGALVAIWILLLKGKDNG